MTPIIRAINLLDSLFTTSAMHTSRVLYAVDFNKSNVVEILEKLQILKYKVENNISTGKHVGAQLEALDVRIIIETLETIAAHYKKLHNLSEIPKSIKLYTMIKDIRSAESLDVKQVAKEVVKEIITPQKEGEKLTRKQRISADAAAKSKARKIDMLKKQNRK